MADQSLSFERGVITSQMGGRSAGAVTLHSIRRLLSMSPLLYSALTTCLVAGGGSAASGGLGRNCTGV